MSTLRVTFNRTLIVAAAFAVAVALLCHGHQQASAMSVGGPKNDVTIGSGDVWGNWTLIIPPEGHSLQNITATRSGTLYVPKGSWIGQSMALNMCQTSGGGWTITITPTGSAVIKGTWPTLTLTDAKCDICGLIYTAPTCGSSPAAI